nr:inactive serine protease 45-like [Penaeus vannamei]
MPTTKKVTCGMRHRRGVLARSAYAIGHELQALYGEFPWQAAIYKVRNIGGGLQSTFVCSGVLVDKAFVITPAHCVVGPTTDFTVSAGGFWGVHSRGGGSILERQVTGVSDILVYPGYESTNPLVHDVALVQLDRAIAFDNFPQIGLACLPYPDILYRNTGAWDCFTVGWNGKAGALQRVESNLLSKRDCRVYTRAYHEFHAYMRQSPYGYGTSGYDKAHGYHAATYQKHHYYSQSIPDLLCTESFETKACVDDPAAVLVCRHAALHADTFFGFGNRGYRYHAHRGHKRTNARIVNAYGKHRFDSEKWYVMGLSHSLSPCSGKGQGSYRKGYGSQRKDISVFTPVHEYLPFIHAHLDVKQTAAPTT